MIIYFTNRQAMRSSKVKGTRIDNGIDSPKGKRWAIQLDTTVAKRTLQIAAKWKAKEGQKVLQQKAKRDALAFHDSYPVTHDDGTKDNRYRITAYPCSDALEYKLFFCDEYQKTYQRKQQAIQAALHMKANAHTLVA